MKRLGKRWEVDDAGAILTGVFLVYGLVALCLAGALAWHRDQGQRLERIERHLVEAAACGETSSEGPRRGRP